MFLNICIIKPPKYGTFGPSICRTWKYEHWEKKIQYHYQHFSFIMWLIQFSQCLWSLPLSLCVWPGDHQVCILINHFGFRGNIYLVIPLLWTRAEKMVRYVYLLYFVFTVYPFYTIKIWMTCGIPSMIYLFKFSRRSKFSQDVKREKFGRICLTKK